MFMCTPCRTDAKINLGAITELLATSYGRCEACGASRLCCDVAYHPAPVAPADKPLATSRDWQCPRCHVRVDGITYEDIVTGGAPMCTECDVEMKMIDGETERYTEPEAQPLTQEKVDLYIRGGGVECPHCGGIDIEGDSFSSEAGGAWQNVFCSDCEQQWAEGYTLNSLSTGYGDDWRATPGPDLAAMCSQLEDCLTELHATGETKGHFGDGTSGCHYCDVIGKARGMLGGAL